MRKFIYFESVKDILVILLYKMVDLIKFVLSFPPISVQIGLITKQWAPRKKHHPTLSIFLFSCTTKQHKRIYILSFFTSPLPNTLFNLAALQGLTCFNQ